MSLTWATRLYMFWILCVLWWLHLVSFPENHKVAARLLLLLPQKCPFWGVTHPSQFRDFMLTIVSAWLFILQLTMAYPSASSLDVCFSRKPFLILLSKLGFTVKYIHGTLLHLCTHFDSQYNLCNFFGLAYCFSHLLGNRFYIAGASSVTSWCSKIFSKLMTVWMNDFNEAHTWQYTCEHVWIM